MVIGSDERTCLIPPSNLHCSAQDETLSNLPVYETIHSVHQEIVNYVDVPLSEEQLRSPEINFAIIQPLESAFASLNDPSIVYVLLLNRLHFVQERDSALASSSLNETRAQLCEILATKLLRHQATTVKGSSAGLLAMSTALVGGFQAFQGASEEVLERIRSKEGYTGRAMADGTGKTNALELAILGRARNFIKSQATQRVITAIWEGRVVYSASSFLDILPDRWKIQQVCLYNIKKAPILDHYRLRVPKYRSIIDLAAFVVLFISFLAVIVDRRHRHSHLPVAALTLHEQWFFIYALGYSLDKIASIMEHGWTVYSAGLTNGLDALCVPIFALSFGFRIHSVLSNDQWAADQAFAILSCAACFMFPRLAFAMISNNVLILSLRAMLADFAWLMSIAVFCFLGFVFALNHLCDGEYSVSRIAEWLIFIWFGLDGKGIDVSGEFHPILGPLLFISYAALSNTLLVSLLVAILSGTYSGIAADAAAEDMFRRAVLTFEGVKCDSLFDYFPPLNLLALTVMWPISQVTSPRWFHKINVATTRCLSLPIILLIALYERQSISGSPLRTWVTNTRLKMTTSIPTKWAQKLSLLEGAHWECSAVFEYTPSGDEKEDDEDDGLPAMGAYDEIEAGLEGAHGLIPGRRITSRASAIISSNPPTPRSLSPTPMNVPGSSTTSDAPTPSPQLDMPPSKSPPSPSNRPTRSSTHLRFNGNGINERLPSNAGSGSYGGNLGLGRVDSPLSSSAPHLRFESPLARMYHYQEAEVSSGSDGVGPGAGGGHWGGVRRRMSHGGASRSIPEHSTLSPPAPPHPPAVSNAQLVEMVQNLAATIARLEITIAGKGKKEE